MQFNFLGNSYTVDFWSPVIGKLGRFVAVDTETTMVPFHMTPDLVTMQAYSGGDKVYYIPKHFVQDFLDVHKDSFFLLQNAPFDMDVLSKFTGNKDQIYSRYDSNLVRDVGVLYRLWHLADKGMVPMKYNLALMSRYFLGKELVKDETRENFSQFLNTDVTNIPGNFLEYGAIDVIATYKIYFSLMGRIKEHDKKGTLLSQDIQVKGDLALQHIRKNGIGFDLSQRDGWLENIDKQMQTQLDILASWGWVRGKKGIKQVFEEVMKRLGLDKVLPRSAKSGDISSKAEDLEPFKHFQFIESYLDYQTMEKASSFVRNVDSSRLHPRYNLLVNTGRTSCSSPNFQQLPKLGGIREMFVPEPGNKFIITDYSAIELATLAQVTYGMYGYSTMRDMINDDVDLHSYYGTVYYGKAIEDITKQERQTCKAPNFGFSGGLGVDTFIQFSRGYGLELTREEAQDMKNAWFDAFPEMVDYMQNERGHVFTLTGRKRGDTTFCAEKNTPFQGLAADGAKLALYNLDKAGFKVVGFVHDEVICEVAADEAERLLGLQETIMIDSMKTVVPDVKVGVESSIEDYYTK